MCISDRIMACASEALDIRAVTTAAGNASLYHTTRNTCNLLHLLGRDCLLYTSRCV